MKKTVRKAVIAGNWKMNKTRPEAKALLEELKPMVADVKDVEVVACVPFTNLETALAVTAGTNIKIGAENCHFEKSGAFTGEISADMLAEMGVEYVVLGHSERRQYFAETDETVNKRTKAALAAGLKPIVCVGELLWERECNITEEVIARQVKLDFFGVSAEDVKKSVIAYEPVWAIGTGKTVISASRQSMIKSSMPIITRESIFTMASLPFAVMKSSSFAASLETRLISSPAVRFDMEFMESCCDFSNISCLRSRPRLSATLKLFFMLKNSNTPARSSSVTIVIITPARPAQ